MRKREIEALLRKLGWRHDDRLDHKEFWFSGLPWAEVWTERIPREGCVYIKLEVPFRELTPETLKPILVALAMGKEPRSFSETIQEDLQRLGDGALVDAINEELARRNAKEND